MREYETTFIVQPEITDDARQSMLGKFDGVLEKQGAVRLMIDDWGKRKLAYEIRDFQKGHYYTLKYLDTGTVVTELERILKLEESILRYLTVRVADEVQDIETRKSESAEQERQQRERIAAEQLAREEEEKSRREEERQRKEAEAQAAAEAAAEAEVQAEAAPAEGETAEAQGEASAEAPVEAAAEGAEAEPAPEAPADDEKPPAGSEG